MSPEIPHIPVNRQPSNLAIGGPWLGLARIENQDMTFELLCTEIGEQGVQLFRSIVGWVRRAKRASRPRGAHRIARARRPAKACDRSIELTFIEPPFWFLENEVRMPGRKLAAARVGLSEIHSGLPRGVSCTKPMIPSVATM